MKWSERAVRVVDARAVVVIVLSALALSGCTSGGGGTPTTSTSVTSTTPQIGGPALHFGGVVVDALDSRPIPLADVRIDLAQTRPCRNEGIGWQNYDVATDQGGRFGLVEVPRPNSDDFAFFLHVNADGYTENRTFVGPAEARADIGNLTIVLHPRASLNGTAPVATVIALDDVPFPRLTVSDATNGSWRFDGARVLPTALVAATDPPLRAVMRAPDSLAVQAPNATVWRLEGRLVNGAGAPIAADVIARNGTQLWSAARASENGFFVLPLDGAPVAALSIQARTSDGHYGATKVLNLTGPPALRETLVMLALC